MSATSDTPSVRLSVPAKADYVVLGRLALSALTRLTTLNAGEAADLKLALTEAATVFVGGPNGGVEPNAALDFTFELRDDAIDILVSCAAGPSLPTDERELGDAILAATVDEVVRDDGSIRLVKRLGPAEREG